MVLIHVTKSVLKYMVLIHVTKRVLKYYDREYVIHGSKIQCESG